MPLPAQRVEHLIKRAVRFDGINDYVTFTKPPIGDEFSVCVYVKFPTPYDYGGIVGYEQSWSTYYASWMLYSDVNYLLAFRVQGTTSTSLPTVVWKQPELLDTWLHACGTYSKAAGYLRLYLNGDKKDEKAFSQSVNYPKNTFYIGVRESSYAKMLLYAIMLYDRALSDDEIQHNATHIDAPVRDGLVLWYNAFSFDPEAGKWYDISGYGNDGAVHGATLINYVKAPIRKLASTRRLPVLR